MSTKEAKSEIPAGMPAADEVAEGEPDMSAFAEQMGALTGGTSAAEAAFFQKLDLGKVKDSAFAALTAGQEYEFYIRKPKFGKAGTGNNQLKFTLEVSEDYPEAGDVIADQITLTEGSMWKLKSLMRAADLLSEDGSSFLGNGFGDLDGRKIRAKVKDEPWNGQPRTKVDGGYKAPDGGDSSPFPANASAAPAGSIPSFG